MKTWNLTKFKIYFIFLVTHILTFPISLNAQNQTQKNYKLSKIEVTTNKVPQNLDSVILSVDVIDSDESIFKGAQNLSDLLSTISGLQLNNSNTGQSQNLFIRGMNSSDTLILIDGLSMNDPMNPSRGYDLTNIPLSNIEKIEVVKNAQSVLYGAQAIGGVISIKTKKNKDNSYLLKYGSFDSKTLQTTLNKNFSETQLHLNIVHKNIGGISAANELNGNTEKDSQVMSEVTINSTTRFSKKNELEFNIRYNKSEVHLDNFSFSTFEVSDDLNYIENSNHFSTFIQSKYIISDHVETTNKLSYQKFQRNYINQPDVFFSDEQDDLYKSAYFNYENQWNLFAHSSKSTNKENQVNTIGLQIQKEEGEVRSLTPSKEFYEQFLTSSLFFQSLKKWSQINTSLALRYDNMSSISQEYLTSRMGVKYLFNPYIHFNSSFGNGFKAPSLSQLYDPQYGEASLKPEKVISFDWGTQVSLTENLSFKSTFFLNEVSDLVSFDLIRNKYLNIEKAHIEGLEFQWLFYYKNFSFKNNWTHLIRYKNLTQNINLVARPKNTVFTEFSFDLSDKLSMALHHKFTDKRLNYIGLNLGDMPSYGIYSTQLSYNYSEYTHWIISINNLFDKKYEETYGYGTKGLHFFVSLKANF